MLRSLIRILHVSLVQIDTVVTEKYIKDYPTTTTSAFGRYAAGCVSALMGLAWRPWPMTVWPWNWYASRV